MFNFIKIFFLAPKQVFKSWYSFYRLQCRYPKMYMVFPCAFHYDDISAIQIGNQAYISRYAEIVVHAKSAYSSIPGALIIGDRVVIGSRVNIRASGGTIIIGKNTLIAQNVSLIAANHTISDQQPYRDLPWDTNKVGLEIGENVWLGVGVTVLPGCRIGDNSVVGAGSVVTKSIPPKEVWGGIPARKLRDV
jgi:acetyltransferase-like isoleucine patch superfamily enzyme